MSEKHGNDRNGAGLWVRARPGWRAMAASEGAEEAPNALILAGYLDGTLDEREREAVEAWMAAAPEALELVAAARADLGRAPETAPQGLIARAQGLVRAPAREPGGLGAWLRGLAGFEVQAWRPLAWAGVTAVLLVVSAGGFELGRLGADRLVSVQTATLDDDLELGVDDAAGDLI